MKPVWPVLLLALVGCQIPSREGGKAIAPGTVLEAPQDPAATSRQWIVRTQMVMQTAPVVSPLAVRANPVPTNLVQVAYEAIEQTIGPAQADPAAKMRASAAALRPVQMLGLGLIVFSIAAMAIPGLRFMVGSVTTLVATAGGGVILALSPSLVPGRETLLIWLILGGVFLYWWAHRHGELRGIVKNTR